MANEINKSRVVPFPLSPQGAVAAKIVASAGETLPGGKGRAKRALLACYAGGNGLLAGVDTAVIYEGLLHERWDVSVCDRDQIGAHTARDLRRYDLVYGPLRFLETALTTLGAAKPGVEDYPESLMSYLGRSMRKVTHAELNAMAPPFFVKPADDSKRFNGTLITQPQHIWQKVRGGDGSLYWVSEIVPFDAEYRVYVCRRKIVDVRRYRGDWRLAPDASIIAHAVRAWTDAPVAYGLDFAVGPKGQTYFIEANDHLALASYGMHPVEYLRGTYARYREILKSAG